MPVFLGRLIGHLQRPTPKTATTTNFEVFERLGILIPPSLDGFSRWWFQIFFIFTPKLEEDEPILTDIFFKGGGSTTNSFCSTVFPWKFDALTLSTEFCSQIPGQHAFLLPTSSGCNGRRRSHRCAVVGDKKTLFFGILTAKIYGSFPNKSEKTRSCSKKYHL